MNLRFVLLWLAIFINEAWSLNDAIPYELLWFYSAYKMDYKTYPPAGRSIATTCTHHATPSTEVENAFVTEASDAGVAGICTFWEFVKHVGGDYFSKYKKKKQNWTLYPDVDDHVLNVKSLIIPGQTRLLYDPSKLHTTLKTLGNKIAQARIYKEITNTIQGSRALAIGQIGMDIVDRAVTESKPFLRLIRCFRVKDQWKYLQKTIENAAETIPFKDGLVIRSVSIMSIDGSIELDTFQRYSYKETIANTPTATEDQKEKFKARVRAFGTTKDNANGGRAAFNHQNAIAEVVAAHELMSAEILGCAGPPGKKRKRFGIM